MTDLTKITTPFGLLDEATQKALRECGGPWEWFFDDWEDIEDPQWENPYVYRLKPQPPKPREWWIVGGCEAYTSLTDAQEACRSLSYNQTIIHVCEVLE